MKQLKFLRTWLLLLCLALSTGVTWGESIEINTSNSGVTGSYADKTFDVDGVTFGFTQWMKNNNIQAKKSTTNSCYNVDAMPGNIKKITVVQTGTARAIKIYGGTSSKPTTEIAAPTTAATMEFDFSGMNYTYFSMTTPGNAVYINTITIEYETSSGGGSTPTTYNVTVANDIANGTVTASPTTAAEGATVTLTATPDDGYEFGEWNVTNASTSEAISVIDNKFTMPASDVNVSATFNKTQGGGEDSKEYTHDVLTAYDFTATSTTYTDFSNVSKNTAVYAGNSAKNNGIQLRSSNSNSGIVSTTSGGNIKKVTVIWNSNCTSGRTIDVYGNSTAYTSASDLYNNSKQGTKLGSIVMGTSTSLTINDDYAYVGVRSNSGALNIDEIDFAWEEGGTTPEPTSAYTVRFDAGSNGTCSTSSLTEESAGAGVTLPEVTANTGWVFQGWSTSSTPTSADAGVAGATYKPSADITLYAYYTLDIPEYSGSYVDIDLSTDNTNTATESEMTWVNEFVNIAAEKGESTTNANNYYPGDKDSHKSTRFYTNSTLTFTPATGCTITGIEYTSTTDGYAEAFAKSAWTNGVAVADATNKIVYVTPSDGTQVISATIGATTGGTNFRIYYSGTPVLPTTYNVTIDSNIENGTVTAYPTSAAEGATVTLTATPATGYEFEAWDVKGADNSSITVTNNKFTMPAQDVTVSATFSPITYTIKVKDDIYNGTVSVSASKAHYGEEISISVTPNEGYEVDEYIVTNADNSEEEVTVTNGMFTMPAYNVNVNVTFKENAAPKPTYTIVWSVNGTVVKSENLEEGATVIAPDDPEAINGKVFTGWVTTSTVDADATPEYVTPAATATENVTYYAVFATENSGQSSQYVVWNINGVQTPSPAGDPVNTVLTTSSVTPPTETGVWTAVAEKGYANTSASKAQLGSGSCKFVGTISLSGTAIPANATITKIELTATSSATDANPYTVSATVNGNVFGTADNISSGSENCSWEDCVQGNQIVLATSCSYNKNIVISSISVTYGGSSFIFSDYTTTPTPTSPETSSLNFVATDGTDYYATFSCDRVVGFEDVLVGDDDESMASVNVYAVYVIDNALVLTDLSETHNDGTYTYVPKNTGVLLQYHIEEGSMPLTVSFKYADEWDGYLNDISSNNMLVPCLTATDHYKAEADEYYYFKLAYDNYTEKTGLGFWWGANDGSGNFKVKAGTALLRVPKGQQGSAKGYTFDSMGEANGIEAVEDINGNDLIYNLQGVRLNSLQKGINIVNGRKVIR